MSINEKPDGTFHLKAFQAKTKRTLCVVATALDFPSGSLYSLYLYRLASCQHHGLWLFTVSRQRDILAERHQAYHFQDIDLIAKHFRVCSTMAMRVQVKALRLPRHYPVEPAVEERTKTYLRRFCVSTPYLGMNTLDYSSCKRRFTGQMGDDRWKFTHAFGDLRNDVGFLPLVLVPTKQKDKSTTHKARIVSHRIKM